MPRPRLRLLAALLATLVLVLAACGNDDDGDGDAAPPTDPATTPGDDGDAPPTTAGEQPPEGAAASVDGAEITATTVEEIFEEVSVTPAVAEQIEGEQGELMAAMLRAEILGQLIRQEIVLRSAEEEFGIVVTDDDLDRAYDEFAEEMGGVEELETQLEQAGLSRQVFERLELPLFAALMQLEDEFDVDGRSADGEPSEAEAELQAWAFDRFASTPVLVSSDYGTWNAMSMQVDPAGMPEMAPTPID
jgi:parvulin-like peptidyl-prolyl isomerase